MAYNYWLTAIKVLQNGKNTNKNKGYKNFRRSTKNALKNETIKTKIFSREHRTDYYRPCNFNSAPGGTISDIRYSRIINTKFNNNSRILYRFNCERVYRATNL